MNKITESLSSRFELQSFSRFISRNNLIVAAALAALAGIVFLFAKLYVHYKKIKAERLLAEAIQAGARNDVRNAQAAFQNAIQYGNNGAATMQYANALLQQEHWAEAENAFVQIIREHPTLENKENYIKTLLKQHKYKAAEAPLAELLAEELPPEKLKEHLINYITVLKKQSKWEVLNSPLERLLGMEGLDRDTWILHAHISIDILLFQDKFTEALVKIMRWAAEFNVNEFFVKVANAAFKANEWYAAENALFELIAIDSEASVNNGPAALMYLNCLMKRFKSREAEQFLEDLLARQGELFYQDPAYGSLYGFLLLKRGNYNRACVIYESVLERHPGNPVLVYLAEAYLSTDKPKQMLIERLQLACEGDAFSMTKTALFCTLLKVMEANGEDTRPYAAKLQMLLSGMANVQVQELTEDVFQEGPIESLLEARAWRLSGNFNQAREVLEQARLEAPYNIYYLRELNHIRQEELVLESKGELDNDQPDKALLKLKEAGELYETKDLLIQQYRILERLHLWEEAENTLIRLQTIAPQEVFDNTNIDESLIFCFIQQGKMASALEYMNKMFSQNLDIYFDCSMYLPYLALNTLYFKSDLEKMLQIIEAAEQEGDVPVMFSFYKTEAMMLLNCPEEEILASMNMQAINNPCEPWHLFLLGQSIHFQRKRGHPVEESLEKLRDAMGRFLPNSSEDYIAIGAGALALDEKEGAKQYFEHGKQLGDYRASIWLAALQSAEQ